MTVEISSAADNATKDSLNNNTQIPEKEYFLIVNNETDTTEIFNEDIVFSVPADDTLEFRILDNSNKIFVTSGTVKFGTTENKEIEPHDILEYSRDLFTRFLSKIVGGNNSQGNNSDYYAIKTFEETTKNYNVVATGEYELKPTKNKITIAVRTNYISRKVDKSGKNYSLTSMKIIGNQSITYNFVNHGRSADELINNVSVFLNASNDLCVKIANLTGRPGNDLNDLPVNKVLDDQKKLEDSINKFSEVIQSDDKLNKESKAQLGMIKADSKKILEDLADELNSKKEIVLINELDSSLKLEKSKSDEFTSSKSVFRNDVFYPAGMLILLGIIIGFLNVNRWKKESEYFGLYTSKAKITSPIIIAIILTVIILILMIAIIYFDGGDLTIFKFLL